MIFTKIIATGVAISCAVITSIFFVAFGQLTVRKLRKNPELKDSLGINLYSGFDITSVASALSLPRSWNRRAKRRAILFLLADADILYTHTTRFDRCLGRAYYWMMMATTLCVFVSIALESLGIIK